jgi:hypothetical protein
MAWENVQKEVEDSDLNFNYWRERIFLGLLLIGFIAYLIYYWPTALIFGLCIPCIPLWLLYLPFVVSHPRFLLIYFFLPVLFLWIWANFVFNGHSP